MADPDPVSAHLARVFPERALARAELGPGDMVANIPDLAVWELAPGASGPGEPWLYVSSGASAEPMEDGYGLEFALCAPAPDPRAARLVAMVANLHADPRYPMSLGQVLEIGHPWLPGGSADHLIIALPSTFGPEFEWLSDRERTVRFIWLVPITKSEAEFARKHGLDALQERLGAAQLDVSALSRPSAV